MDFNVIKDEIYLMLRSQVDKSSTIAISCCQWPLSPLGVAEIHLVHKQHSILEGILPNDPIESSLVSICIIRVCSAQGLHTLTAQKSLVFDLDGTSSGL